MGRIKRRRHVSHVRRGDCVDVDVSKRDVSSVADASRMCAWTTAFGADVSKGDVSGGSDLSFMFAGATAFDVDTSK